MPVDSTDALNVGHQKNYSAVREQPLNRNNSAFG